MARARSILKRGLLTLVALAGATYAAAFSLRAAERYNPTWDKPVTFAQDGIVRLHAVLAKVGEGEAAEINATDAAAIRASLIERPLNAQAIAVTGLSKISASGSDQAANPFMALADRVSRRDPVSQVWMIESASAAGDVPAAIRHYNAALSVKPELGAVLFPVLSGALGFGEVRDALKAPIRAGAPWMPSFIATAAASGDLDGVLALVASAPERMKAPEYKQANAAILYRLVASGRLADAQKLARQVATDLPDSALTDFAITPATRDDRLGNLAWQLTDNEGISAAVEEDGTVSVELQPLTRGAILAREIPVAGGQQYEFRQTVARTSGPAPSSLRWQATCSAVEGTPVVWSQLLPTEERPIQYKSIFKVPIECHVLKLELVTVGPEGQLSSSIRIYDLFLKII